MSQLFTFEALGTQWWIELFETINESELEAIEHRLKLISSTFENTYSRFREDSLIGILNRRRTIEHSTTECLDILKYGTHLYIRSGGVFNILTGHIQEARGYNASYSFTLTQDDSLIACNPATHLHLSETKISVDCGNIDLGGYGKGWLIDTLATDLKEHGFVHFLINGGGDMFGTSLPDGRPIPIYLEHPTNSKKYLVETTLFNQGFAASSPFKRQWKSNDKTYTHIVGTTDIPETATFVKATTATDADAFATVAILWPKDSLPSLAETERLAIAYFDPATAEFWQTTNFNSLY
jgi:FAD:protein FMN transferase